MDALIRPLAIRHIKQVNLFDKQLIGPVLVAVISSLTALGLWTVYSPNWRQLWTDVVHDRNAHLEYGLGCASDLVHFRIGELVRDIDRSRTWPPLHEGAMVAVSLMIGGLDPRAAIVPSLICYAGAGVLAFLLARRMVSAGGNLAGAVAAVLILASPAMRAFAIDVMMEVPGACFTLGALYAAVRARQDDTAESWRALAIALSALFFVKYNYWLLVMIGLAPLWWFVLAGVWSSVRMAVNVNLFRHPVNWLMVILLATAWWMKHTGRPTTLWVSCVWWAFLVRWAWWYFQGGRQLLSQYPRIESLVRWHGVLCAIWLAWPGKMASFLWMIWPGTNVGEFPAENRLEGFRYYLAAATTDYHMALWSTIAIGLMLSLAAVTLFTRQLRPGAIYVFSLVVIAALLTAPHPNRKSRFLHSWLPCAWVLAGVGTVAIRRMDRRLAVGAASVLIAAHVPSLIATPHAPEGGLQLDRPCALELTDAYLPHLKDVQHPAILCNVPLKFLARWTYLDRYGRGQRALTEVPNFDVRGPSDANAVVFHDWLTTTKCDAIVLVELPPTSPWFVPVPHHAGLEQFAGLMREQSIFKQFHRQDLPDRGSAAISVWRKVPG